MALKTLKCRQSKRQKASRRYKIIKRIAEHKRKQKKEANKLPKKKGSKTKLIQVPNICPFKEDILNEVKIEKERVELERLQRKELLKQQKLEPKLTLQSMVLDAETRAEQHETNDNENIDNDDYATGKSKDNSLKAFFKEFKKVVDIADVILEVVDARDPLGTRCEEVAEIVRNSPGQKRLVLVLNKADLVPRENLEAWLNYLRKQGPVIPFKATTQTQKMKLGRIKFKSKPEFQRSPCIGADILTSLLANYCRNNDIKTSIRVGIVGIPNVGKSSIINSLKRKRACNVGGVPGVTRQLQEVEIDKNIKLIDSPGIIFQRPKEENPDEFFALKNAQHVNTVQNPYPLAEDILHRASMHYFCRLYNITEYHSVDEFLAKKAQKIGRFGPGGIPDVKAAARSLIHDWNTGKIKYFTHPPDVNNENVHLGSTIVTEQVKEFGLDDFEATASKIMDRIEARVKLEKDPDVQDIYMEVETKGPVHLKVETSKRKMTNNSKSMHIVESINDVMEESSSKKKKRKAITVDNDEKNFKNSFVFQIDGNMTVNKNNKKEMKKIKKQQSRNTRKVENVANVLENFSLGDTGSKKRKTDLDSYDFNEDFEMK
ncbi:guanine nucleotide-binding protein-like 3 homolog [Culicoides brevitarsis]|uniref:guanine nucleotide-binding protein-like 3 homolog n=1 Tax=Culicoides brevitarsis TaxID=469753 RepID=UPI00307C1079